MPELEERQAKIEAILEQLMKRVDKVETELHANFRWLVGIIIVTWITTIATILIKG